MLSCVQLFVTPHGLQPARLLYPRDFPGKNTGMGCHALLQGISHVFCIGRQIFFYLSLSHLGIPEKTLNCIRRGISVYASYSLKEGNLRFLFYLLKSTQTLNYLKLAWAKSINAFIHPHLFQFGLNNLTKFHPSDFDMQMSYEN